MRVIQIVLIDCMTAKEFDIDNFEVSRKEFFIFCGACFRLSRLARLCDFEGNELSGRSRTLSGVSLRHCLHRRLGAERLHKEPSQPIGHLRLIYLTVTMSDYTYIRLLSFLRANTKI